MNIFPVGFRRISIFLLITVLCLVNPLSAKADSSQLITQLRVDLSSANASKDYIVDLSSSAQPSGACCYTAGWLGVFLAPYNGTLYSGKFAQVGIKSSYANMSWFVFSEAPMTCLEGTKIIWSGQPISECDGPSYGYVNAGSWVKAELVTYGQSYWIARIWDSNGVAHDVAKIFYFSTFIYNAQVSSEEAFGSPDPHLYMSYNYYHPKYMSGSFQDWPVSVPGSQLNTQRNYLRLAPFTSFCPSYYSAKYWYRPSDMRFWTAGSTWFDPPYECTLDPVF